MPRYPGARARPGIGKTMRLAVVPRYERLARCGTKTVGTVRQFLDGCSGTRIRGFYLQIFFPAV